MQIARAIPGSDALLFGRAVSVLLDIFTAVSRARVYTRGSYRLECQMAQL